MPWALVIRLLIRVLAGMFLWRTASARRGHGTPVRGTPPHSRLGHVPSIDAVREGATLGWRLTALTVFIAATAVLVSAGVTLTVLSPRWLGITLLVLATACAVVAGLELRLVLRVLEARRKRRQAQSLRAKIS
jgi:hypothetical protein